MPNFHGFLAIPAPGYQRIPSLTLARQEFGLQNGQRLKPGPLGGNGRRSSFRPARGRAAFGDTSPAVEKVCSGIPPNGNFHRESED